MDDTDTRPSLLGCLSVLLVAAACGCAGFIAASLWIVHVAMGD